MTSIGIDYGMGTTNRDAETGIRYGVISQHTVGQAWYDDAEPDYGKPTCPACGNELKEPAESELPVDDLEQYTNHGCADYVCDTCAHTIDSEHCFGDESIGWSYSGDGYELTDCLDSDIFVLKSPFYTFAQFCSPCVPGAGNLESPIDEGAKTFCLGHDWFEDRKAPYRVFRVSDDSEVLPD